MIAWPVGRYAHGRKQSLIKPEKKISNSRWGKHSSSSPSAELAVTLMVTVVGASIFGLLPLIAAGAADTLAFSSREVGSLSLTISVGSGLSALLAVLWVRSTNWRNAACVSLSGMLIANAASMFVHNYWHFVLFQGISGFCGASACCVALTILSDRKEPARAFGLATLLIGAYQAAAILAGPSLLNGVGLNGVLALLACTSGCAALFVNKLPTGGKIIGSKPISSRRAVLKPATIVALVGFFIFFVNTGAYWTYVELIGGAHGISARVVASCVSAGVAAGMLGSALAWALGERWGKLLPLCIATAMTVIAGAVLNNSVSAAGFVTTAVLHLIAWNYAYSYQLSLISEIDVTGRAIAVTQAFAALGAAAGAGIASLFVKPQNYQAVGWLVVIAACVSTLLFAAALVIHIKSNLGPQHTGLRRPRS